MNDTPPDTISRELLNQHRAEHALQTSEARLHSVLESVADGIIVIDERGIIEAFNGAAEQIFGYRPDEVLGRNVSLLMPEPDASAHDGYLRNHLETGRKQIIGIGREVTGRRKDGGTFPMSLAVNPMQIGEKRCFTGIVRDISARKHHEWEMLQTLTAAEAASRAKTEFLSSMSHELRTPLNSILGFAQLLKLDQRLVSEQTDSVQEILNAGRRLLVMINEVLDLARIESGQISLSMEPVELGKLIEQCIALTEPSASPANITVQAEAASCKGCWVRADRPHLKHVLINLLSNAVKYNRAGGSVQISCDSTMPGRVRLSVSDTGPGIAEDKLAGLFTPFNRLGREAGSIEGSGIGLVICKRLVEMMGGEIGVENRPGDGCTFWLQLSAALPLVAPAHATCEPRAELGERGYTVLYIEDNPSYLRLMQDVLKARSDIRLLTSGEPLVGLVLARTERPDLILLDINLPTMSGYEVLNKLKNRAVTRDIPVIALSGHSRPEEIECGLAAGFQAYLTKPLELDTLHAEINRLLALSARERLDTT
jgi:PAS domain S-box-containing protein